jgi:hypothetical protein
MVIVMIVVDRGDGGVLMAAICRPFAQTVTPNEVTQL